MFIHMSESVLETDLQVRNQNNKRKNCKGLRKNNIVLNLQFQLQKIDKWNRCIFQLKLDQGNAGPVNIHKGHKALIY